MDAAAPLADEVVVTTPAPQQQLRRNSCTTDVRGVCRLATDAVAMTTRLVEALHSRYDPFSRLRYPAGTNEQAGGVARLVYQSIYAVNGVVGTSVDVVLGHVVDPLVRRATVLGADDGTNTATSPTRELSLGVLNGVIGDYLEEQQNPLAISMQWRVNGATLDDSMLTEHIRKSGGRLLLLVHGSCSTDLLWLGKNGHDHGVALESDVGLLPLYLFYNTGLHISDNGKQFALQMNRLAQLAAAVATEDSCQEPLLPLQVSILAHSMGGLVVRSACHYAATDSATFDASGWLTDALQNIIFLGTPHHGAILERGGKLIDRILSWHSYSEPFSWIGKIRSSGVTDLGYGNVRDEDWQEHGHAKDYRQPTPLPTHVRCFAIAAVLTSCSPSKFNNDVVGDGLVTESSALGKGNAKNPDLNLMIPPSHQTTVQGVSHAGLLNSVVVYDTIKGFLTGS